MADGIARILAGVRSCSSDNQGAEEKSDHVVVVLVVVVEVVLRLTDNLVRFNLFISQQNYTGVLRTGLYS